MKKVSEEQLRFAHNLLNISTTLNEHSVKFRQMCTQFSREYEAHPIVNRGEVGDRLNKAIEAAIQAFNEAINSHTAELSREIDNTFYPPTAELLSINQDELGARIELKFLMSNIANAKSVRVAKSDRAPGMVIQFDGIILSPEMVAIMNGTQIHILVQALPSADAIEWVKLHCNPNFHWIVDNELNHPRFDVPVPKSAPPRPRRKLPVTDDDDGDDEDDAESIPENLPQSNYTESEN